MSWLLRERRREEEIMDQPGLAADRHDHALGGLTRLNWFCRSASMVWPALAAFGRRLGTRRLRILDVATGGGDIPVRLWHRARRAGLDWQIDACDCSTVALDHARRRAERTGASVRFFHQDIVQDPPHTDHDAVISSLFLHHLDEDQARALLRWMAGLDNGTNHHGNANGDSRPAAPRLVLVNDLERSLAGFVLAHVATRMLTTSRILQTDGPRSVASAFTRAEARELALKSGLDGVRFQRRWPCRYLLYWSSLA